MRSPGFSLLELSIVLVIIGLLAGGVMVGQDLIRQSELRSIMTDINKVQTAINAFKSKYSALPGDIRNATAYWGTAATCPATAAAPLTTQATCNGNGNGTLYPSEIDGTSPEWWLLWQHLANAGLFEGSFTGASVTATTQARPGRNVPETKISGVGFTVQSLLMPVTNNLSWWYGNHDLMLSFGYEQANTGTTSPAFSPIDVNGIDTKMDDGRPGMGVLRTLKNIGCVLGLTAGNATTFSQSTAEYDLTQSARTCSFTYSLAGNPGTGN